MEMTLVHRAAGALLCVALTVSIAGCGIATPSAAPTPISSPTAEPTGSPTAPPTTTPATSPTPLPDAVCATPLRVGLVADAGRVDDGGYNESTIEGVQMAIGSAPSCFQLKFKETANRADFPINIASFADAQSDIIIGVGPYMADALGEAAANYPTTRFIGVDAVPGPGRDATWSVNGESLVFAEDELGYIAGVLAASISESAHVGVVGGPVAIPAYERYVEGFVNGAKATRPDIVVDVEHVLSVEEPATGYAAAGMMTDAGADVIFAAAQLSGNGALLSACDATRLAIGANTDQYRSLPEAQRCLLSSVVKGIAPAVRDALIRIAMGKATSGITTGTASNNAIGYAPFYDNADRVSSDVEALLRTTLAGLADGSITTGVVVDGITGG